MKSSQRCLCIKVSVRNLSLMFLRNILFVSFFFEKWFISNMKMHSNWKYSCHENAKRKTCFALFSASVMTLGLHEWSLYDFFSSCNSFFNRPIYDVYTSFDGLAGNTAKCVFQSPVEAKKNTSNEKMYTLCNLFLFLSLSLCRER